MSDFSEAQKRVLDNIKTGFHIDSGTPCECDPDHYSTRKEYGFSDSLIFHHRCGNCGNEFSTWIEG